MNRDSRRDRSLERALVANFLVHGLAMLSMAGLLLPYLPGGSTHADLTRVELLAAAPWPFRLGWFPWQLCAVCDLWMAIAMARTRWLPRVGTLFVLVATIAAVIPDQLAQARWITEGVTRAASVTDAASLESYLTWERATFNLTAGVGASLYTLSALGWTFCFARAGTWRPLLTWLSIPLWCAMGVAVVSPLLPASMRPDPRLIAFANAVGFALLQIWLALVTEEVLRRRRPPSPAGRLAQWRFPRKGLIARAIEILAESRFVSAILEPLPVFAMVSDITDVVYVSYLIEADRVLSLVPEGLELDRLGEGGRYALFTFLTFRHGHFGFRFLGPIRRLSPSAIQTNWRIHVKDPRTGLRGIFFVTNAITQPLQALGARLFTEGMPMHILESASIERDATTGRVRIELAPGNGSAPDGHIDVSPGAAIELDSAFRECFGTYRGFLAYCVPQNRSMSSEPWHGRVTRQEIDLPIPLDECVPVTGTVRSQAARAIAGDAEPVCFYVSGLAFSFSKEVHDPFE